MQRLQKITAFLLLVAGILYPLFVYCGLAYFSPNNWALLALALIVGRMLGLRRLTGLLPLLLALAAAAILEICCLVWQPQLAMLLYPVFMSLSFTIAFAYTLISPPSMVERFASMHQQLPSLARPYLHQVTRVWVLFLSGNTVVSTWSVRDALYHDLQWWTLYNGLISYLLMGLLFAGEWLFRQRVRQRHEQ
ncbi:MAG: hypothetical protein HQM04_03440 [Magnetococcales bacterium]|nr:hypothetical protein [Magnetococcales bacterium]MBF0114077.1 hypothetical protein [Magnetococcales bacterium]